MALAVGTRLGPYEVVAPLGAGGMAEVYKARDTRLDRTVAIKVLPPDVNCDPERRARFEREAKTIAGLNHAHICSLYDVGRQGDTDFLVMEHVAGETLASRLQKGPLPLEQALIVATEIADALAVAHRQCVIHRDLKPANVMLTKSGAKLLDFGLAKLRPAANVSSAAATFLPTGEPITEKGLVLGTVPYMAPEQLEGKEADARSDIFSFGAVLYEILAGKRAFEGTSAASVIAAILERDPASLSSVQPLTPPALDRLVRRCLAKVPDDRPDTAHDVADDLRWMRETSGVGTVPGVRPHGYRVKASLAAAGIGLVALIGATMGWLLHPAPASAVVRSDLSVRPAEEMNAGGAYANWIPTPGGSRTALTLTPDGRSLIFVGRRGGVQQLYVRPLDSEDAHPLAGTEGAQVPAVSPNGQWVAFWAEGKLRKVPVAGGPVVDVASGVAFPPKGLSYDADGTSVYFGNVEDRRIWKAAADGRQTVITPGGEAAWAEILPWPLPGGQALLCTVRKREWTWGDEEIVALTLATGTRKRVLTDAADARYVAPGYLVFLRRSKLFAVPFDAERLEVQGPEVALFDDVGQALTGATDMDVTGAGQFAIAPTGTLAWVRGPVVPFSSTALVSVDRNGRVSPLGAPQKDYFTGVRLAPGGRQLAVVIRDLTEIGLFTYDLERRTLTSVVRGGEAYLQVWAPDGQRLVFSWLKDGQSSLALQRTDATNPPQVLGVGAGAAPTSWKPDSSQFAVVTYGDDLAVVTIENDRASMQVMQTPDHERCPEFSPDGHWLAYDSDESSRKEVYVRPYPGLGRGMRVSIEGGESPTWNGHELFFLSLADAAGKRRMMVARFEPGSPAPISAPQSLFEFGSELKFFVGPVPGYAVAPDGQRFYVIQGRPYPPPPVVTHIRLVQNWQEELKAKVGTPK